MQLFNVRYEPLCVVELQHEYYTQKEFADFQLQPSTATANLMRQYGILLKQVGNKIYLLVQTEQMRPKRIFDKPLCWSFYIHIKNGYFTNFTNTRLGNFREHVYYFNNLNSNVQDNTAFLSQKITPFQKNVDYQLGDWVQDNNGKCWEAIQDKPTQAPKTDGDQWQLCHTQTPCVTFLDHIPLLNSANLYSQAQQYPTTSYDPVSGQYTQALNSSSNSEQSGLFYRPNHPSSPWCYAYNQAWQTAPFAIIELHFNPNLAPDYALLDKDNTLKSPKYTIRFANRSTWWRYLIHNQTANAVQDKNKIYQFSKISDREFISDRPIPLSQQPIRSLLLQVPILGNINPLPNPNIQQIMPENGKIYSNIHLNY